MFRCVKSKTVWTLAGAVVIGAITFYTQWAKKVEFVVGGAMVNVGYRLQDRLDKFDFEHQEPSAEEVWQEFLRQNDMAASVRDVWPRTSHHPLVAFVACMDARLDTNEIAGDTRRYYYILRLAGSVLEPKEEDMLELAVANGTKVVVFTTHTDCAAEKMYADPAQRQLYPALSAALTQREERQQEFLSRPVIREKLASGELVVKRMKLDTATDRMIEID